MADMRAASAGSISKSRFSYLELSIVMAVVMLFIVSSVWVAFFLNMGKDIEEYKKVLNEHNTKIATMNKLIQDVDQKIEKYLDIVSIVEGK